MGAHPRASVGFTDRDCSVERVAPRLSLVAVASRVLPLPVPRATHGLSDRVLVARVASGDDQAFEEILERYGPALLSFCAHMLGSREWGEDALQLTFVTAYQALRRGGCDGALRPWLYAIARNRCLSELRARREIPDSDRVSAERPAIDDPASLFARREQLREIVEDIQRLPADQRAALVLFELGDHSHEEIATVLGVRRDKVKALIFQAREGLYRGRNARESACSQVRDRLANARGNGCARGLVRAHVDRCASCQEFEREVRRQRAALALVLPVALSGKLKALVLSSTLGHGGVATGSAGVTGAGGAGSVAGATTAGSGSGMVAGSGSLGAGAAATASGSASTAVGGAGAAAGGGAVSAAAGTASSTMVASALGTDALVGVGALTSSVSAGTVAKLATALAVAVGVGGATGSAVMSSPRPQVSPLAGQPAQAAPPRSPPQPPGSGIAEPLASATEPGSQPGAGATAPAGRPQTDAASAPGPSSIAAPSSSAANPATVREPTTQTGRTSAPPASAPGDGSATTTAPSSAGSTTTATPTTTTASSPTGSGRRTSTTTTASSPMTTTAGSSSGSSASQGPAGGSSGASGKGPGDATGQGRSSGGNPAGGVTNSNGNGPPVTPPGCVSNPAPGCTKRAPRS
jgi:RNA polymerase sigma factor (sigma-70 family)